MEKGKEGRVLDWGCPHCFTLVKDSEVEEFEEGDEDRPICPHCDMPMTEA